MQQTIISKMVYGTTVVGVSRVLKEAENWRRRILNGNLLDIRKKHPVIYVASGVSYLAKY